MKKFWTRRKFWDGTEAIFVKNKYGGTSCYNLDSDELGDIITKKKNELNSDIDEWQELQKMREEYISAKKSD